MGRPKKAIRPIEKNISLPEDICAKVDLQLYSPLEQRVPHGSWSRYITGLIRKDLEGKREVKPGKGVSYWPTLEEKNNL